MSSESPQKPESNSSQFERFYRSTQNKGREIINSAVDKSRRYKDILLGMFSSVDPVYLAQLGLAGTMSAATLVGAGEVASLSKDGQLRNPIEAVRMIDTRQSNPAVLDSGMTEVSNTLIPSEEGNKEFRDQDLEYFNEALDDAQLTPELIQQIKTLFTQDQPLDKLKIVNHLNKWTYQPEEIVYQLDSPDQSGDLSKNFLRMDLNEEGKIELIQLGFRITQDGNIVYPDQDPNQPPPVSIDANKLPQVQQLYIPHAPPSTLNNQSTGTVLAGQDTINLLKDGKVVVVARSFTLTTDGSVSLLLKYSIEDFQHEQNLLVQDSDIDRVLDVFNRYFNRAANNDIRLRINTLDSTEPIKDDVSLDVQIREGNRVGYRLTLVDDDNGKHGSANYYIDFIPQTKGYVLEKFRGTVDQNGHLGTVEDSSQRLTIDELKYAASILFSNIPPEQWQETTDALDQGAPVPAIEAIIKVGNQEAHYVINAAHTVKIDAPH